MKQHNTSICGNIHGVLHEMHSLLVWATGEASVACDHIDRNEQNMAIGTIVIVEDLFEKAAKLCKAALALHSLR